MYTYNNNYSLVAYTTLASKACSQDSVGWSANRSKVGAVLHKVFL